MKKTKRKDHYIPQGYLRGFIDPSREKHPRPLWRLEIPTNTWSARSPKEVGHRRRFYDYVGVGTMLETETADSAFLRMENDYPLIRREMVSSGFARWTEHLEFLLGFMQMMRARSTLFREQRVAEGKTLLHYEIEEVYPDRNAIKLKSMTPTPVSPAFIKNRAITEMREEIQKGAAWLKDFDWALRYSDSITDPFVISEVPFIVEGPPGGVKYAVEHPDSLLMFPLCWQACLFGSRKHFDVQTQKFGLDDMRTMRKKYRAGAEAFMLSPVRFDEF
jgi:hypothetical protein